MKKRIWELDMLRGFFMILIMLFHLWYDLVYLYGLTALDTAAKQFFFGLGNNFGGTPFLLISGLCATIGSKPVKRGLQVLGGGALISAVTTGMYLLNFADKGIIIYFGVLHCIGTCMLLWSLFKKCSPGILLFLGISMIIIGFFLRQQIRVEFPWLVPLGVIPYNFSSSDYFPLLPNLGYFLIGAAAGRKLYPERVSLFSCDIPPLQPITAPLCFIGKHSLIFYLLHQPVMAGAISLGLMLFRR